MTDWLRAVTEWNPISTVAAACRELSGGEAAAANDVPGAAWPVAHPVVAAVGRAVLLLASSSRSPYAATPAARTAAEGRGRRRGRPARGVEAGRPPHGVERARAPGWPSL
ncbi:hypothetical protein V1L54_23960 [Streptomyces sp. TRM 70361]|uniref:hypothetical protein n=1 Tax=Streptomyces sp. TRM 70361 TaxID=3116553 RepID=UPI002E7B61EF|nr:hypothetical protein [Streptomyces sp. TRM 70361]MEE1942419.1 hypothetical protein [Streptomyces sp. TRM 70361]